MTSYQPKNNVEMTFAGLLPFLYSAGEVQKIFSPPLIVSYRSAKEIKDYMVRSNLYPVEKKVVRFVRA